MCNVSESYFTPLCLNQRVCFQPEVPHAPPVAGVGGRLDGARAPRRARRRPWWWRGRQRHGAAAADAAGFALCHALAQQAQLHQEQLPGLAQIPQEKDARWVGMWDAANLDAIPEIWDFSDTICLN